MHPPTDRKLASDINHVVLTSDTDRDTTVLDHSIEDIYQWAQNRHIDGPEEFEGHFDNLGILKVTKTITTFNNDNSDTFETILKYFETFNQYLPPDDYEAESDDLFIYYNYLDPLPPEFRVFETQSRPSVLFITEPSTLFDIEPALLVPTKPTRAPEISNKHGKGSQSSGKDNNRTHTRPPPRINHEDPPDSNGITVYKNPSSAVKSRERDWERLRKHFAWLPKLVMQKIYYCTTNLTRIPMSVSTMSPVIDVYGITTDAQFFQTLQNNVRKRRTMNKLVIDSATSETSKAVQNYLRWIVIVDCQLEPYQKNQNPAERTFLDIKRLANTILNRTGASNNLWLLALRYASSVYNHTAIKSLDLKTTTSVLTGITPDISILLRSAFSELVYFKNNETSSEFSESLVRIVGIAEHVSHALIYKILDPSTNRIICKSEIDLPKIPRITTTV